MGSGSLGRSKVHVASAMERGSGEKHRKIGLYGERDSGEKKKQRRCMHGK